jgi:hypothetical protein
MEDRVESEATSSVWGSESVGLGSGRGICGVWELRGPDDGLGLETLSTNYEDYKMETRYCHI